MNDIQRDNVLDKLIAVSANNTDAIAKMQETFVKEMDKTREDIEGIKKWLVDNIHVDSEDIKAIKKSVKTKVIIEVGGYPNAKYRKAIAQLYDWLEAYGKGNEIAKTKKRDVEAILEAIPKWHYIDYDS